MTVRSMLVAGTALTAAVGFNASQSDYVLTAVYQDGTARR